MQSFQPELQTLDQARQMLDLCASVGVKHFDVTFLDIDGKKRGFRASQTIQQLNNSLLRLFPSLLERRNSLIVHPHSTRNVTLIQLDDLNIDSVNRLHDISFLSLQTSPGNFQSWVAVSRQRLCAQAPQGLQC